MKNYIYILIFISPTFGFSQNFDWIRDTQGGSSTWSSSSDIKTDALGNYYVIGSFRGVTTFGSVTLTPIWTGAEIFISKFDPSGEFLWARQMGGTSISEASSITLDANGKEQIDELVRSKSRSKMRIRPKSCEQITDNEFIIYAVGKKSYSFAGVVLN